MTFRHLKDPRIAVYTLLWYNLGLTLKLKINYIEGKVLLDWYKQTAPMQVIYCFIQVWPGHLHKTLQLVKDAISHFLLPSMIRHSKKKQKWDLIISQLIYNQTFKGIQALKDSICWGNLTENFYQNKPDSCSNNLLQKNSYKIKPFEKLIHYLDITFDWKRCRSW